MKVKIEELIRKKKRGVSFLMVFVVAAMAFLPYLPPELAVFAVTQQTKDNVEEEVDLGRIYVNNTPVRLEVSKIKTHVDGHEGITPKVTDEKLQNTITYQFSGRVDGSESYLMSTYGSDRIELAYTSFGVYLGYGWIKGTKEYLEQRKKDETKNDESVKLIYNEFGVFSGYAYITRRLQTADNANRYVAGAAMTLYDSVEVFRNRDYTEDDKFEGLVVERNASHNVTNMYIKKGYAGSQVKYVLSNGEDADPLSYDFKDEINDKGNGTWIAQTVERGDTPVLYYSLDDLTITSNDIYYPSELDNKKEINKVYGSERYDAGRRVYGFDATGNVVDLTQTDETDFSAYGFRRGSTKPEFEFAGGDFSKIRYNRISKTISVGEGTRLYHLDQDGNRDSLTDPQTGLAYLEALQEEGNRTKVYTWPVNTYVDRTGSKTMTKISTSRIATINADTEDEYITGTFDGKRLVKSLDPTLDEYGLPVYYQRSDETYVKGTDLWDRDGDYLGYSYDDKLDQENLNAYTVKEHDNLYNGDSDDPFNQSTHYQYSGTQKIRLTVDVEGNFIVNGKDVVPVPERDGKYFAGWLISPDRLTDGCIVNAGWSIDSPLSQAETNRWYSSRPLSGTARTITVTFHANGGLFQNGSGDIHSSDNKLYHKKGESFLIDNSWITGENTPNDPFDAQIVASIDQTSQTSNDPYNDGAAGGKADMLKRVAVGSYIMEEIKAPAGYVKSMPVGFTLSANKTIQKAEMVDSTIKLEIVKVDGTDSYQYHIYEDGALLKDSAGTEKTITEPKGSYSYRNVIGAVLALYADGDNKEVFSHWIKATNAVKPEQKKQDAVHGSYIIFPADRPVFLENIPKGNYVIREIVTPPGYITAPDQRITVTETGKVQMVLMNDDHTKVEIKKYYNNGNGNQVMPNKYRAGLQLKDGSDNIVTSWYTDDVSDYTSELAVNEGKTWYSGIKALFTKKAGQTTGFTVNYEKQINSGNMDVSSVNWQAERTAEKKNSADQSQEIWEVSDGTKVVIVNGNIPEDAPEGFRDAYANRNMDSEKSRFTYRINLSAIKKSGTMSDQLWESSTGAQLHICVYGSKAQGYIFEYKFNYKNDYSGDYVNTVSYDTVDGTHRFDYLPEGTYTLHEFDVPEGFMQSDDAAIVVKPTGDIQLFTMKNLQRELVVTKYGKDSDGKFYAGYRNGKIETGVDGIEIKGATLRLYKVDKFSVSYEEAFKKGLIPAGAVLSDEWITGSDGVYTELDYKKELIPPGYQAGDDKPHTIKDLSDGYYYLVETGTPDYYRTADPVRVEINSRTSSAAIVNKEMSGKISVHKKNGEGRGLAGAVFEVKNKDLGKVVGTIITDHAGNGTLIIDDIAAFDKGGKLIPYTFTIIETNPPAGYQNNYEIHEFTFKGDVHMGYIPASNDHDAAFHDGVLTVMNSVSAITISKSDYTTGMGVPGADLALYEAVFDSGIWKQAGNALDSWTTANSNSTHVMNGLVGGKSYVLTEVGVPAGYVKAKDLFFRVSGDARSIEKIWYDPSENPFIEFTADSTGAVDAVRVSTRTVAGSKAVLTDQETGSELIYGIANDGFTLTDSEITEGHSYRLAELIRYSDGTEIVVGTTTFLAVLEEKAMKIYPKYGVSVENTINSLDGSKVAAWISDGAPYTILNPLITEKQGITIQGATGKNHSAVKSGDQIIYVISYEGKGKEVVLKADPQTEVIRTEPSVKQSSDGTYRWITGKDSGVVKFIATAKDFAAGYVNQKVTIGDSAYTYINPIAVNHGEGILKDTSKLVVFNDVFGTDPNNGLASFTYKITLSGIDGSPLKGSYDYRSKDGKIHSFDAYGTEKSFFVTLNGSDYIVIHDLPYNAQYIVQLVVDDTFDFTVESENAVGKTKKESVSNVYFSNTRNTSSERTVFKKNETYNLTERTIFHDSTSIDSAKYGFTLGEHCEVKSVDLKNKSTEVEILKESLDGEDLSGAVLQIQELDGTVIEKWISTTSAHVLTARLEAGKTYVLHEVASPEGYRLSKDIRFSVSDNGTIDKVVMKDLITKASITKYDITGTEELAGARLQIIDQYGTVIEEWVSDGTPHYIEKKLLAGESYILHEAEAPNGYSYAEDVRFTVSSYGTVDQVDTVVMKDAFTRVKILKVSSEADLSGIKQPIEGAVLQILDSDKNPVVAIRTTDDFKMGDTLTFTSRKTGTDITGLLNAGETYYLHEVAPAAGYAFAPDVAFEVNRDGSLLRVIMEDFPIKMVIRKSDITGGQDIPGARLSIYDRSGTLLETWISDGTPHTITAKLTAGESYVLREEGVPDGYGFAEDITFQVTEDGKIVTDQEEWPDHVIVMKDPLTKVIIHKTDITGEKEVPGATLSIRDSGGKVIETWVSGTEPHVIEGVLHVGETYTLVEEHAPEGYGYSREIQFKLTEEGFITEVTMKDTPIEVYVSKKDATGQEEIPGSHIQIIDKETGELVDEWISDGTDHLIPGNKLKPGRTYIIHESGPPDGYDYSEDQEFCVNNEGGIQRFTIKDDPTHVRVTKTASPSNAVLAGTTLQILDENKQPVIDKKTGKPIQWVTGEVSKEIIGRKIDDQFTDGLIAGKTYYVHEVKPTEGYAYAEDAAFTLPADFKKGQIIEIVMQNIPTQAVISKIDAHTGKPLEGALLQIRDKSGNVIEQWTSTASPHIITGKLEAGGTYTLIEVKSPDGYAYAKEIPFTVNLDGTVNQIIMEDKPTQTVIRKTDFVTGEELSGAGIQIIDKDGNVVEAWTSGVNPHVITGKLIAGETYTLRETYAPDGYAYTADVKFTVNLDGTVDKVELTDKLTDALFSKYDGNSNRLMGGAHFQLLDSEGKVVEEWDTIEGEKHRLTGKLIAGAVYRLVETKAPPGYQPAKDLVFTAGLNGEIEEYIVRNFKNNEDGDQEEPQIILKKYDGNLLTTLEGAEFTIFNPDGTVYTTVVTDENGMASFTRPPAGTYTYKETKAPEGYLCSVETYTFTVDSQGNVSGQLVVKDYTIPDIIIVKKDEDTQKPLSGAAFSIADSQGNVRFQAATDQDGTVAFRPLWPDTYTVTETEAPEGYIIDKKGIQFTVAPDGTVTGTTVMYNKRDKVGTITAVYDSKLSERAKAKLHDDGRITISKTGDDFNGWLSAGICLVSVFTAGLIVRRKRRRKKKLKRHK